MRSRAQVKYTIKVVLDVSYVSMFREMSKANTVHEQSCV